LRAGHEYLREKGDEDGAVANQPPQPTSPNSGYRGFSRLQTADLGNCRIVAKMPTCSTWKLAARGGGR
jgi:hypothetical protein